MAVVRPAARHSQTSGSSHGNDCGSLAHGRVRGTALQTRSDLLWLELLAVLVSKSHASSQTTSN